MRRLVVNEFLSLGEVMQGPGSPDEDTDGGFAHGGWQIPYFDDGVLANAQEGMAESDAYLFGRSTYQIMAAYWPSAPSDDPFAGHLNRTKKIRRVADPQGGGVAELRAPAGRRGR